VLLPRPAAPATLTFLYGLALERRLLTAASVLDDSALGLAPPAGLPLLWEADGGYRGPVSVRTALASSLAAPALRTLGLVGTQAFQERLEQLGLDRSTQIHLLALTSAQRVLALGGEWGAARLIQDDPPAARRRVLRRDAGFILADILGESLAPSAEQARRGVSVWVARQAVEAGDGRDAWVVGVTERHAIGVRLGGAVADALRDDEGASIAAALWRDLARLLHADVASRPPRPPQGVATRLVRFEPPVEPPRREWFIAGTELELVGAAPEPAAGPARIAYPAMDATILINRAAPGSPRMVFLARNGANGLRWRVNGTRLEVEGGQAPWAPVAGRHRVALLDRHGAEIDAVEFAVREAGADSEPAQQQGGEQ
jgi:penicillin-binding protein 1C